MYQINLAFGAEQLGSHFGLLTSYLDFLSSLRTWSRSKLRPRGPPSPFFLVSTSKLRQDQDEGVTVSQLDFLGAAPPKAILVLKYFRRIPAQIHRSPDKGMCGHFVVPTVLHHLFSVPQVGRGILSRAQEPFLRFF